MRETWEKVLIVSLGSIGQRHLMNVKSLLPNAEVGILRLSDRKIDIKENATNFFSSLEKALDFKPGIVIVSSPATEHLRIAQIFSKQGANIFIEKPLCKTLNGNQELLDDLKKSSGFIMVGYVLRFMPLLNAVKKALGDGIVGEVRYANIMVGQYLPDWRPNSDYRLGVSGSSELGGGTLLELSHEIDYACWLFGKPDKLLCYASKLTNLEIDVEDYSLIILRYPGTTMTVTLQMDFIRRDAAMQLRIVGADGTIEADLINEDYSFWSGSTRLNNVLQYQKMNNSNEIYLRQFDYFFSKTISSYKPHFKLDQYQLSHCTLEESIGVLNIVDAAREYGKAERFIALNTEA